MCKKCVAKRASPKKKVSKFWTNSHVQKVVPYRNAKVYPTKRANLRKKAAAADARAARARVQRCSLP
jgi:hypothetical protein